MNRVAGHNSSRRESSRIAAAALITSVLVGTSALLGWPRASSQVLGETVAASRWYRDLDRDGEGDWYVFLDSAGQPPGYVANSLDCNDRNGKVNQGHSDWYGEDHNCDGRLDRGWVDPHPFPSPAPSQHRFDVDGDGARAVADGGTDCNDFDPNVYADNIERVNNYRDDDCDLRTMDGGYYYPRSPRWLVPVNLVGYSYPPGFEF